MKEMSYKDLPDLIARVRVEKAVFEGLQAVTADMERECKANAVNGVSPDGSRHRQLARARGWGQGGVLNDRGEMIDGIECEVLSPTEIALSSDAKQARIHQYGGTLRPIKSQFLAIPLTETAARAEGPRNYPGDLVPIINANRTAGVLVPAEGGDAVFALTKGPITIPAREFIGFSAEMVDMVLESVGDRVADAIVGVFQ